MENFYVEYNGDYASFMSQVILVMIIILFALPGLLVLSDFVKFIISGNRLFPREIERGIEVVVIIGFPVLYLGFLDFGMVNDCCSDSATFSPEHRLSVYTLIGLCICFFFYSSIRKKTAPPIPEIIVNSFLVTGIVLNIFIAIQVGELLWLFGNLPVIILFIIAIVQNQRKIISTLQNSDSDDIKGLSKVLWKILNLQLIYKIPALFVLSIPILIIVLSLLMLFGQKPDSLISAFTDTYKHGLSQLDYMCKNVECGGHYLCSVAANGHKKIVRPQRIGIRASKPVICNRQLLIANAFEELLEQNIPVLHKVIRNNYNRVGDKIHKYYSIFNNKIVADIVYLLMKPLEWLFLIVLYTFDNNPENRIAVQYLDNKDRNYIKDKY